MLGFVVVYPSLGCHMPSLGQGILIIADPVPHLPNIVLVLAPLLQSPSPSLRKTRT